MKKLLFLLFGLLIISSCGSEEPISTSDKPETDDNINEVNEIKQSDIVGVWEKGNYFISFGNDGFYSAYIADKFIDSGNYTLSKGVVSCNNTYFNRNTTYTIKSLYDAKIEVNVTYTDVDGNNHNRAMTFAKTTAMPASQSNTLAGKTYTWKLINFWENHNDIQHI
nr:MAG TPA: Protein involved in gliding motility 9 Secretion System Type.5A [Caudoviricetes sp.]